MSAQGIGRHDGHPPEGYSNQTLYLPDLVVSTKRIEDTSFSNCHLIGPAFLGLVDTVSMINCTFEHGDVIWEVEPTRSIFGAIPIVNVSFSQCRFENVSFLMSSENAKKMRRNVGLA